MVTGGTTPRDHGIIGMGGHHGVALDSTELLRPGSDWQVITSARLPRPLTGVRVTTVDNRVILFGEWNIICI